MSEIKTILRKNQLLIKTSARKIGKICLYKNQAPLIYLGAAPQLSPWSLQEDMNKKRVIVGMSGGVDSSVAAALLKEQNYDVIGVYILGWTGTDEFPCNWQSEEADARAVAEHLGIPFYAINLSKEYEQAVIDDFFANYAAGLTPNPDILCNREIKFKALWQAVRQFEPDYIATGHYARLGREITSTKHQSSNDNQTLLVGDLKLESSNPAVFKPADREKDQTYFLWGINRAMLPSILFPLGELTKPEVRERAKKYNLPTAKKKDSQGICFVGPLKVREFLASRLEQKPGQAVLADGRVIAQHEGVNFYTIGQRLAAGSVEWTGDVPPLFVIAKDLKRNLLVVGSDKQTEASSLWASQANWLVGLPKEKFAARAKIRYRQEDVSCTVSSEGEKLLVTFDEPVRAITPGQSIVFYDDASQLLGGAVITSVPEADQVIHAINEPHQATRHRHISPKH